VLFSSITYAVKQVRREERSPARLSPPFRHVSSSPRPRAATPATAQDVCCLLRRASPMFAPTPATVATPLFYVATEHAGFKPTCQRLKDR